MAIMGVENLLPLLSKISLLGVLAMISALWLGGPARGQSPSSAWFQWPDVTMESRPWTRWWWHGNAVSASDVTKLMEQYAAAGLGGVEITPIYGVKGREDSNIDYLSPEWVAILQHVVAEGQRLGMGVDMSTGTGWPFGGPQVTLDTAASKIILKTEAAHVGELVQAVFTEGELQALTAVSDSGETFDLLTDVDENGSLTWTPPIGEWTLVAAMMALTGQKVKRAAPGGQGLVMDHFSAAALDAYLQRFDQAFEQSGAPGVRAFFNDSFEVYGADWTDNFLAEFEHRRGYDLRPYLPALAGIGDPDQVGRVRCDYRETISDLLLEYFVARWTRWSHGFGAHTRHQAHGSPGNLLDLYAAADIPETEAFGPSIFTIPDLRREKNLPRNMDEPDTLMSKFASSAAHLTGKRLASSESCTWLGEHFKVALSQIKPELDKLFAAGINHIVYHGTAYSPPDEEWPGRLFYASVNFSPSNPFWNHFPQLNAYVTRVQSVLQSGDPAADVLLYWPVHDLWHIGVGDKLVNQLSVHNAGQWLRKSGFGEAAAMMQDRGYMFDYVSDRMLQGVEVGEGKLTAFGAEWRAIVVPRCRMIPVETMGKLLDLAAKGATIIFVGEPPSDVPGLGRIEDRRGELKRLLEHGGFMHGDDLEQMLTSAGVPREPIVDHGVEVVRRTHEHGYHYFLANLGDETMDGWTPLGVGAKSVAILDPIDGRVGVASVRKGADGTAEVYLQLRPGESLVIRTFTDLVVEGELWPYLAVAGDPMPINGTWKLEFLNGGPSLPDPLATDSLRSWTRLGGDDARHFSGTARYSIEFELSGPGGQEWLLDLGQVAESAEVWVNGVPIGVAWSFPFILRIGGGLLVNGLNTLEIEVTNLAANRIILMDRDKIPWKKFEEINFVNIQYQWFDAALWPPMDSGLIGPVRLIPAMGLTPGEKD